MENREAKILRNASVKPTGKKKQITKIKGSPTPKNDLNMIFTDLKAVFTTVPREM